MHRLYIEWREDGGFTNNATLSHYRKIFCTKYNLYFFKPKKDCRDLYSAYEKMYAAAKLLHQANYEDHVLNKDLARQSMIADKQKALSDSTICVMNIDMQQVMELPNSHESCLYYTRKLSAHNLTIYDMATHEGICNVWDETIANRGGNKVASAVYKHIANQAGEKSHFFYQLR